MKIVIPTYRRDRQLTFSFLSKKAKENVVFFLSADAAERDRRALSFLGVQPEQIVVCPTEVTSIAKKRAYILQFAAGNNPSWSKILMFDDDLRFATRRDGWASTKLYPATPEEVDAGIQWIEDQLDTFAHAGIGARQGNNTQKLPVQSTARMMYALGYRVADVVSNCELGRIETREDFDYTLQLLRRGHDNLVNHTICVDQSYNNPGGCRDQRTIESSNADAEKLAELHPGLVRVVEKDYKASLKRKEVVVQWKKALGHG